MKRAPRSRQRHDLYAKYHDYDSEISDLLGECGLKKDLAALQAPLIFAALFLAGLAVLVTISVVGDRLKGLGQAKAG